MDSVNGLHQRQCQSNWDPCQMLGDIIDGEALASAPPVPIRPKSTGFVTGISDSPEVPPKLSIKDPRMISMPSSSVAAPPLPPRGCTPDKRASNPIAYNPSNSYAEIQPSPNIPKRAQPKLQIIDISLEDQTEVDNHLGQSNAACHCEHPPIDFRDSGISTASNDLNNPNGYNADGSDPNTNGTANGQTNYDMVDTECLNIQLMEEQMDADDLENENPPPIPKKTGGPMTAPIIDAIDNDQFQEQTVQNNTTPVPPDDLNENKEDCDIPTDGYCVPKI